MGDRVIADIVTIATAIVGLAIVATIVSNKSSTGTVITDSGTAFANVLKAATGNSGGLSL